MKNTYFSLLSILALLTLSSCHQRIELGGIHPDTPQGEVSVDFGANLSDYDGLTIRSTHSRALTSDLTKDIGRFSIDGIRIVLYKQNPQGEPTTVAYVFQKNAKIYKGKISGTAPVIMDKSAMSLQVKGTEKIAIDDYTVLFFTSPPAALKAATMVGKEYSELKSTMTYDYKSPNQGMRNLGFNLYSNVDHPIQVTAKQLSHNSSSTTPYHINATQLSPINALLYLNFPSTLSLPGFKLNTSETAYMYADAQNKKFTLFPQYEESQFDTPMNDKTSYRIPKDPNYEGFASKNKEELENEFEYLDKTFGTSYIFYNDSKKENNTVMPIAENTLKSSEANGFATTRLIVGIPLLLNGVTITNNSVEEKSFFIYDGKTMSVEEMRLKYMNALSSPTPDPEQTKLINEVKKLNEYAKKTGVQSGGDELLLPNRSGYDSPSLKYYNEGFAYYLIPCRHFADTNVSDRDKPGRFGIVRNTLYYYNIVSLSKIGAPTPLAFTANREYNYNNQINTSFDMTLDNIDVIESNLNL